MSAAVSETSKIQVDGQFSRIRLRALLLIAFSLFYFADVSLRASEKFFWYDELFTLYFSRLPTFHALWNALNSGIDFNPPLFYMLTRWSNLLFGEGTISTRLPEILGFWIFCLCLFRFVSRRAGTSAGVAAMLFPMTTGAYFYAYEARPHGIVLGFAGLAIVCWQMAFETAKPRLLWLVALAGFLFCAFMTHCFALVLVAPFGLVQIFRVFRARRIEWAVWIALAVPSAAACLLYIPLLRSYRKLTAVTTFSHVAVAGWTQVAHFYFFLLGPCILVVTAALVLFALRSFLRQPPAESGGQSLSPATTQDLALGLALTTLPAFGVALGKLVQGPFFSRYFLSALAGLCILIGIGSSWRARRDWLSLALVAVLLAACGIQFFRLIADSIHGRGEWLEEPSSKYALDTTPGQPLALNPLLLSDHSRLPIAVLSPLDFIYLVHYAPLVKPRLYFVAASQSDFTYVGFKRFLRCCPITFNEPATSREFTRSHADYLAYGSPGSFDQIALLGQLGSHLDAIQVRQSHFLARLTAELPLRAPVSR